MLHVADYMLFYNPQKDKTIRAQEDYEEIWLKWFFLKDKQKKKHLKLSNHFRTQHLNG